MENLIIKIYETAKAKPDQVITIPINKINIGKQLLPVKAKSLLEKEAIDISKVGDLVNKNIVYILDRLDTDLMLWLI